MTLFGHHVRVTVRTPTPKTFRRLVPLLQAHNAATSREDTIAATMQIGMTLAGLIRIPRGGIQVYVDDRVIAVENGTQLATLFWSDADVITEVTRVVMSALHRATLLYGMPAAGVQ